ncbi:unnamed protein product [Protopolystoma xenopodis]|uniref:Uncharacterized protein n=1 Tax=Protopolystoma xenopodis TaxID=117903 RepID=A0A3S5A2G9_9PLAT|nr:unnamed protein product [Protopolystoma xenopodis]
MLAYVKARKRGNKLPEGNNLIFHFNYQSGRHGDEYPDLIQPDLVFRPEPIPLAQPRIAVPCRPRALRLKVGGADDPLFVPIRPV